MVPSEHDHATRPHQPTASDPVRRPTDRSSALEGDRSGNPAPAEPWSVEQKQASA